MEWFRCSFGSRRRSPSCPRCGCRNDGSRALRARLLVTMVQGSWIDIQVWELVAR